MGQADGREDPQAPGARRADPGSPRLPRRLGRRPDHRPGRDVSGPARGRAHLLEPGSPVRPRSPGVLFVRPVRGGGRLHPRLLRRGVHGRGEREHVPGLTPDGRDGDRAEGHPRGDGRRADALLGERLRGPSVQDRGGGDRGGPRLPRLPALFLGEAATRDRGRPPREDAGRPGATDSQGREPPLRHL